MRKIPNRFKADKWRNDLKNKIVNGKLAAGAMSKEQIDIAIVNLIAKTMTHKGNDYA